MMMCPSSVVAVELEIGRAWLGSVLDRADSARNNAYSMHHKGKAAEAALLGNLHYLQLE
jgi:hypothetical protein